METSTQPQAPYSYEQKAGTQIEYEEFEDHGTYVTGIARYSEGQGNFQLRVSGQRDYVTAYAQTARIVSLTIYPAAQVEPAIIENARVEFWRRQWAARIARLGQLVQELKPDVLREPDRVWQLLRAEEQATSGPPVDLQQQVQQNPAIDLAVDRYIEIVPVDPREKDVSYYLSFYIDPQTVAPRFRDVYNVVGAMYTRGGFPVANVIWDWDWVRQCSVRRGTVAASGGVIATYDYYGGTLMINDQYVGW